ncbi:MAG: NTP transferase domain-containing protein [Chloroflexota bacterium]|nr:NTP transferase domain-containing protein [Chloroflexota bacterium]
MLPVAVLAGGLATRLQPLTHQIPKALIEVRGEPFVAHQLRLLKARGIQRVVMCVGFLGDQVRSFVGNGSRFGLDVQVCFDGPRLLGTAGALRAALPLLGDSFFVLYGDSYLPCDYVAVQSAFQSSGQAALMTVFRNEDRWDRSNIEFVHGVIARYDKRSPSPGMRHIDYGLGVLSRRAIELAPEGRPYDLALVYQRLLERAELAGYEVAERFYEIGSWDGIRELTDYLSRHAVPVEEPR